MPTIDAHDPGTHLLDRPRQHRRGRGDGILLRPLRLDRDRADRGRGRLPDAAARRPRRSRAWRPCGATPTRSTWSTYVASADADQTCAAAVAERRRGRDGRDGRAHGRAHGDPARSRRRPGLGLAARRPPGLRGARRARRADLERADDARPRVGARVLPRRLRLDGAGAGLRRRPLHASGSARDQLVGGALEMDESWPEDTHAALDGLHRDGRLRRDGAPLRRARRHGLASAGRHRPRPLRAARGSGGRRLLGDQLRAPG